MRNAFAEELTDLAARDERIVLLSADIGNRLFDRIKDRCPDRFFNCGVAEANMISMAAGMALCGFHPVAYTIASFITARCLEQIRLDMCYQRAPVVIVGTGAGLGYASLNATHHSCEDIAFLRVLPNMTVLCPGDPVEVRLALRAALAHEGPVYLRIGKKGEPTVHAQTPTFTIGQWIALREGRDVCLLSTGNVLPVAMGAAEVLTQHGVSTGVVSCHTVKPLDQDCLAAAFASCRLVATLEEHTILGGFGGSVAEWLSDHPGQAARLLRFGTGDAFLYEATEQEHARGHFGLNAASVARKIQSALAIGVTP